MSFKDRSVLVTGATGFIGMHLVQRLLEAGARVQVIAREESEELDHLRSFARGEGSITVRIADVAAFRPLKSAVQEAAPSIVFHLASKVDPSRSFEVTEECLKTNTQGTFNLLEAVADNPPESFILTSTTEVYGNNPTPFNEKQNADPPSPYAISKVAAEQFCAYFHRIRNIPFTVLRMSSCYGPWQKKPRLIPSVFSACFNGSEVLKVTSGKQKRDFLYAEDAVEGLLKASVNPKARGQIINLAGKTGYSVKEVVDAICALAKTHPRIEWNSFPHRANENKDWKTNIAKAKKILGWSPKTSLEEGLAKTYRWWRERISASPLGGEGIKAGAR